jgi:poly(hydroxyalkanoate) depolymerase family esterase
MFDRLFHLLARLRTWLRVRLGLWHGQWRRGRVEVPAARLFPGLLAGDRWSYGLYCPRGLRNDAPAPLVVLLHGCKQRALGFAQASGFTRAADAQRFRLLCPEQRRRANLWRCWNWFTPAAQRGHGELEVVRAMLEEVGRQVTVAPGTVAAVGLSAGGGLAALLAFHAADRIDAVVAVAAPPLLGATHLQDPRDVLRRGLAVAPTLVLGSGRAVAPLMVVHGLADDVVNPRCAEQLIEQAVRVNERSRPALQPMAMAPAEGLAQTDYRDAGGRLRVRALRIEALGHLWSGAPGGHPFVAAEGAALTRLAVQFLRDVGLLTA